MKSYLLKSFRLCLMVLLLFACTKNGFAENDPNRISLAISGGASMGAYEAGLIWGLIEVLKHAESSGDFTLGGELRPIEIASITGSSGGGINALLAGLTWSVNPENKGGFTNQIDDNIFRDVWLSTDVNQLLPSSAESPQYLPDDALLSRRDLIKASRELQEKWHLPGSFRPGIRLPIGLTVTRVKPEVMNVSGVEVKNQRFYIPFEMRTLADGSIAFFFDPNDYPVLSDPEMILMPWAIDDEPFIISDQQVQDALLATSAFPVGFGRRRLQYCRIRDFLTAEENGELPGIEAAETGKNGWVCPDGYEITEAEFADGGMFDNLPIGLARLLSESGKLHAQKSLPVQYIYLDPERERYKIPVSKDPRACEGENPPDPCEQLTYDLISEALVIGDAIITARTHELYRELTSQNWRLNLPRLTRELADIMDAKKPGVKCPSVLSYFGSQLNCSDRLRNTELLLELAHSYRMVPIRPPLSPQTLLSNQIAKTCRFFSGGAELDSTAECSINTSRLRNQLAKALVDLSADIVPEEVNLKNDIQRSVLSTDSDRTIHVTSRGSPITGSLLGAFGAFLEYKFREFDYYVGIYDAVVITTNVLCSRYFPSRDRHAQFLACRDQLSRELYHLLGVADLPKSRYAFALLAKQEFGPDGELRYAYDPMPPEDSDIRIIFDGLNKSVRAANKGKDELGALLPIEQEFFSHLKTEGFEPTPQPEGGESLLAMIMDDPEFWSYELIKRVTDRLVYLEKQAEAIYRERESDPEKQDKANVTLMGAGALALRTATYKYPKFTFSPSTAPENWFWRNIIPYEAAFDLFDGDLLLIWQPTWNVDHTNLGIRMGLGFTGGAFNSSASEKRKNYGSIGLDFTRMVNTTIFTGWGITPAVYHNWNRPAVYNQTSFGGSVHINLLTNRVCIGLGARDIIHDAEDTLFLTLGIADLPGLFYWLSR